MIEAIMKGRFTLYPTPDGGYHIAYLPDGDGEETRHMEVPGAIVHLAKLGAEGKLSPMKLATAFMRREHEPAND
jgi:hypothetical protein